MSILTLPYGGPGPHRAAPAGAPNVLLWILDDTGFAQTSAYGGPSIRTPTLQRLAHGGLKFTNFHTTALCSPSRAGQCPAPPRCAAPRAQVSATPHRAIH